MYISKNINFSFLANQNSDDDLTPQVVRVIQEKNRDGTTRDVLVLKFFCRVDRELLKNSNCQKIDLRLSKHDLSFYRSTAKLTQTKVAVSKVKDNRKEEKEKSDSKPVQNFLKNRQEKRKDRKKKRKNRREERKNRRRNTKQRAKRGVESLFGRNEKDSGDRRSRRRGGFKNRDRKSKKEKRNLFSFAENTTRKTGRVSRVKSPLKSKVMLEPKSLILTAKSSPKFRLIKNQDVFAKAKRVSAINFEYSNSRSLSLNGRRQARVSNVVRRGSSNSSRKEKMLAPETILQINKANYRNISRYRNLYRGRQNTLRVFQKQYLNMVESSIDPIFLFEDSFGKTSFNQSRTGARDKVSSNTKRKKVLPVIREMQRQISEISSTRYDFKKVKNPSRYKTLECFGRISLEDLQDMGNNAFILFIAKDKNNINLQAQSFSFRINNVLEQIVRQSTSVKCSTYRNPQGVCKLNVSNLHSGHPADINIEVKKIKRQDNFIETDYNKILGNYEIPGNSSLVLIDGNINTKRRTPVNFNASDNLFFRTTINYRGKKYYNANSSAVKGVKGSKKNDNIPNLNIIARIDPAGGGMLVDVNNISVNIAAVKLKKYRYNGSSKGKILDTFNQERQVNNFQFLNTEDGDTPAKHSLRFVDTDVFEDKVYMYVAECIMKNGQKKLATDYFIEKYESRTQTVLIEDIDVTAPSFIADASEAANSDNEVTRRIQINFKISKIETEVDKIITNMFGNLFDIFSDELKKIKDVQGLVYSIEVQRIEEKTGDAVTVGKVTADKSGNCVFIDDDAPAFSNVIYKLIPRVRPANEVITSVVSQTPFLAKKTISRPVNFVSAAARINARNRNNRVFTAKKDKFNDRVTFKRGRIRPPKDILQSNSEDLFADASTGDVAYVEIGGLGDTKFYDTIEISDGFINEIRHINPTQQNAIGFNKRYYELEFETNNDFLVDFYAVFIKEGKNVYLDGALHSEDTFREVKEYTYLVEHTGSIGVVEYYVVPILKTGKILAPKLVSAQLIE